ncbi:hypothetical protein ACLB2K_050965 [Fragaria x ananassa]
MIQSPEYSVGKMGNLCGDKRWDHRLDGENERLLGSVALCRPTGSPLGIRGTRTYNLVDHLSGSKTHKAPCRHSPSPSRPLAPSHYEASKKTRILNIDGGGTTAIVAGEALIHLEDQIRLKTGDPHAQIVDLFDLDAGTGIGDVLAAMLFAYDGSGRPLFTARDVVNLVAEKSSELFNAIVVRVFRHGQRYSGGSMDKALTELLTRDDRKVLTLKETCKPLLVPCYDLKGSAPFVFSSVDASLLSFDFELELPQVCRATSATPGLFKPFDLRSVDGKTWCSAVDGGLVLGHGLGGV